MPLLTTVCEREALVAKVLAMRLFLLVGHHELHAKHALVVYVHERTNSVELPALAVQVLTLLP